MSEYKLTIDSISLFKEPVKGILKKREHFMGQRAGKPPCAEKPGAKNPQTEDPS